MEFKKPTVFIGLSGGVDSSVSAALLKKADLNVVGVFIRTWQPDFIECSFRQDRLDAMRVAAHLDIPFLECDAEEEYKRLVAEYMVAEYAAGRTPNPDIMCNREIKFGVFWKFAKEHGADFIATGHYAQIQNKSLMKAVDSSKDQAYFLWTLTQEDFAHILFPIGHLRKTEVRKLAEKFGLPTAAKKDSQGICMLGDLDLKRFLSHYIPEKRGDVLNEKGEVIGHHDGAVFLTLGERHGFTITKKTPEDERYYIVGKDVEKNTITVSHLSDFRMNAGSGPDSNMELERCSWVNDKPEIGAPYTAQIRYHGELLSCTVSAIKKDSANIHFEQPVQAAPGQSVVLYAGMRCVGGGIIR